MHAATTYEMSTFPLSSLDCKRPVTPSTYLQATAPGLILIVTKAVYIVDFVLGNSNFLSRIYHI